MKYIFDKAMIFIKSTEAFAKSVLTRCTISLLTGSSTKNQMVNTILYSAQNRRKTSPCFKITLF